MIDKEKLRELASNPANKVKDICEGLGISDPTLYQTMGRDPELKQIFQTARAEAKAARAAGGDGGHKVSARSTRKKTHRASKKKAKRAAPPRNGRAKSGISDELLRKIKHEFEHIALYNQTSEFFDAVAEKVKAIK